LVIDALLVSESVVTAHLRIVAVSLFYNKTAYFPHYDIDGEYRRAKSPLPHACGDLPRKKVILRRNSRKYCKLLIIIIKLVLLQILKQKASRVNTS
jgi:hypothetical protein